MSNKMYYLKMIPVDCETLAILIRSEISKPSVNK